MRRQHKKQRQLEPTTQKQTQVKGGQVDQTAPPEEAGEEESKGTLTVAFGRFNPPTIGHENFSTLLEVKQRVENIRFTRLDRKTQRRIPSHRMKRSRT